MTYKKQTRKSAAGSEKFAWKLFGDVERICWRCKKELRVKDVGEHRRKYPGGKHQFLCLDCQRKQVDAFVERTRRALELQDRTPRP